MKISELPLHDSADYLNNMEDIKSYLRVAIIEDNTLDDISYSIAIVVKAIEKLKQTPQ